MNAQPQLAVQPPFADALGILWLRSKTSTLERIALVEHSLTLLIEGCLDNSARREAERAAHKLAGSLGTFGLGHGSDLAREIEQRMADPKPFAEEELLQLSELAMELRAEVERGPSAQRTSQPGNPSCRLLLIDDTAELCNQLAEPAAASGIQVERCDGIAAARAAAGETRPDAVLLNLPDRYSKEEMAGFLEHLLRRATPALIYFNRMSWSERVDLARSGVRLFFKKPMPATRLLQAVTQVLDRSRSVEGRILAVDDDPQVLATIEALLSPKGITLSVLDDPEPFWDALERYLPDLVILDVDMPGVSGIDLCAVIRSDPRWEALPVLFLTGYTDAATIQRVFAAGGDDFVAKPIVGPELVRRVVNRLERMHLLQKIAETDPLTGLANRHKSNEAIARYLSLAARQKQPLSVAIVAVDHFKSMHDIHGHGCGDDVLQRLATLLLQSFRGEDIVARWGGEEFLIGVYNSDHKSAAVRLNRTLAAVHRHAFYTPGGDQFHVSLSAGVAEYPIHGFDLAEIYRAADQALSLAKARGGNRVLSAGGCAEDPASQETVDLVLVEDDEILADILLHNFETQGLSVRWIADGDEAATTLSGPDPRLHARVVVLDVDLPSLDGLSVLKRLADTGILRSTRVIMLTVRASEPEVLESLRLGAFEHLSKPFSIPILLHRVRLALRH
ncbi:MAG: response regulator [Gammaproteobacteria bacterium]